MDGGGHERGMRSGTLNVPGIVGFGKACRDLQARKARRRPSASAALRERLHRRRRAALDDPASTAHAEQRLPGNLNISFAFVEGEALMMAIKDVAVSSGSACTSASLEPSLRTHARWASATTWRTRRSASASAASTPRKRSTTWRELVIGKVSKLRDMSPLYEMHKEGIDIKSIQWVAH